MRTVTTAVGQAAPFIRTTATCASCRRQTLTLVKGGQAEDKCAHCSRPIESGEDVQEIETDRFHRRCWVHLTGAESVRSSKALSRRSQELIRRSRELMGLEPLKETAKETTSGHA